MKKILLISLGTLLLLGVGYRILAPLQHGELAEKSVYATLQWAESERRGNLIPLLFEIRHGRLVAGVLDKEGGRVWMALSEVRGNGGIYAIPDGAEVNIECRIVKLLGERHNASIEVIERLKSTCVP